MEVTASFGARIIDRPFDGDFARQRNVRLSAIKTLRILRLDADEILSPELPAILDHVASCGEVDGAAVQQGEPLGRRPKPVVLARLQAGSSGLSIR
jgi:hypothetical protein